MKHKYFILAVILLITGSVFIGCNNNRENAKDNVEKANKDMIDAQVLFEKEWQQFKSDAELKVNDNEQKINELKAKIKTARADFQLKYEKEVTALEQKNIELKKKVSEYKYEGKDKWEQFKQEFNRDIDIVGNAIKNIFTKKN